LEKEMQEVAAMLECTEVEFLPEAFRQKLKELGGRERPATSLSGSAESFAIRRNLMARVDWFDDTKEVPVIDEQVQKLEGFRCGDGGRHHREGGARESSSRASSRR
jgi:hypothetical protein